VPSAVLALVSQSGARMAKVNRNRPSSLSPRRSSSCRHKQGLVFLHGRLGDVGNQLGIDDWSGTESFVNLSVRVVHGGCGSQIRGTQMCLACVLAAEEKEENNGDSVQVCSDASRGRTG
jgi:hypothetical protein